ncbi:MAG: hypothetical protein MR835_03420 [Erysipelotrichaceae bacterium]|nr:hypothetical protein [Erysipelotrichaceae bacterium]MDY3933964.1 hypothetical protein [Bacilli bacterium]
MKNYIYQFYNEGFATTFYLKPVNYLKKNIRNNNVLKILIMIVKILYTILIIAFAIIMFIYKFPL